VPTAGVGEVSIHHEERGDMKEACARLLQDTKKMLFDSSGTLTRPKTKLARFAAREAGLTHCPTFIIEGGESALYRRRIGELRAKTRPRTEGRLVPQRRCLPHPENFPSFDETALGFLGRGER
jgi:hypothetical protein